MILTVEAVRIQVQPLRQAAQHQVRLYKTMEMRQQKMLHRLKTQRHRRITSKQVTHNDVFIRYYQ